MDLTGMITRLGDVMGYLEPELRAPAVARLEARRRDEARGLLDAVGVDARGEQLMGA